jgi:hypothetical protein
MNISKQIINNYNYNISLDRYSLLKKIDVNLLDCTIEEMFDIGYSTYVKNFVKKSFEIDNSLISNEITNTKDKDKGLYGENIVYDIIINKFNNLIIENTSKIPHSGDINIIFPSKKKMIVEVKNYNKTVDVDQIDKLKFDMKYSKVNYSILLSLNSGIVGKKKFELESFLIDGILSFILHMPYSFHRSVPKQKNIIIHNSFEECINNLTIKLEFAISVIENISNNMNEYKSFENNFYITNIENMTEQLNMIYDEFKLIKKSSSKLEENIIKNLNSHLSSIKDFEFSIKKRISSLISDKINLPNYNIYIKKYSESSWNIYFNNKICGRIVLLSNSYCVFISEKKTHYNKQFSNFDIAEFNITQHLKKRFN